MTYDPSDTPAAQLNRYIADVEERPRRRVRPGRWRHFAPLALLAVGALAAWIWDLGRMLKAW